jgi:exopolysaccharide biosynthesis polyprenyl glycosylphosphotransferase
MSTNISLGARGPADTEDQVNAEARVAPPPTVSPTHEDLPLDSGRGGNIELPRGKYGHESIRRFLLISDLCLVWITTGAGMLLAAHVRYTTASTRQAVLTRGAAGFLLSFSVLIVLFARQCGLYEAPWNKTLRRDLGLLSRSVISAALITGICNYLWRVKVAPAASVALAIVGCWISLAAWRTFLRGQMISGLASNKNILIVGCGPNGVLLRRHLEQNPDIGYVFKGYIDRRKAGRLPDPARNIEEADIVGPAEHLSAIVQKYFIDEVFISVPSDRHLVKEIALHARIAGLNVRVVPDLYEGLANNQRIEYVGTFPTMTLNQLPIPTLQFIVKRFVDIVVSASLLTVLMPVLLLIAVIIKLDSKGPILYSALRVGKKGETFLCLKFRTMVAEAHAQRDKLAHLNERDGILFKISADPRITRVGRFLRKFSLDELPQLWNVLKTDMSLVGPRPSAPGEYTQYALEHLRRLDVTPGVTGLWQVTARRDPSFENYIALDKQYVNNWSLGLDCKILLKTISVVFSGTGQ